MDRAQIVRFGTGSVCGVLLAACAAQPVAYDAKARFAHAEARSIIELTFQEQPRDFRPLSVEATDEAIRLGIVGFRSDVWTNAVAAVQEAETYYYSRLAEPALFYKRETWRVKLANRDGTMRRWVIFTSEQRASEFLDAIRSMQSKNVR